MLVFPTKIVNLIFVGTALRLSQCFRNAAYVELDVMLATGKNVN